MIFCLLMCVVSRMDICYMGIGQIRRHIGDANLAGNN